MKTLNGQRLLGLVFCLSFCTAFANPKSLCNPNASAEAKALYAYLVRVFGQYAVHPRAGNASDYGLAIRIVD
jgi:hypothetical protein